MIRPGSIGRKSPASGGLLVLLLLAACPFAFALNSDATLAQLYHTAWTIEDGAPSGIFSLAQTKDGYLWLGTDSGLFRFDGVRFERYQPERGDPFPSQDVARLAATPDGGLWISFRPYGAAFVKNGRGHSYGEKEGLPTSGTNGFALDRSGALWAGTTRGLFRFTNSHWEKIGSEWGYSAEQTAAPFVDSQGKLWVNGDMDLYCLPPGAHAFQMRKIPHNWSMYQAPDGTLWMWELKRGTQAVYGSLAESYDRSKAALGPDLYPILLDREGGFWMKVTTVDGLRRVSNLERRPSVPIDSTSSLIQEFTHKDGLTGDYISSALQDTEGNVWVATAGGLDRFRRKNVMQGPFPPSTTNVPAVLMTDQKGIIWDGSGQSLMTVASDGVSIQKSLPIAPALGLRDAESEMTAAWRDAEGAMWIGGPGTLTRRAGGLIENIAFPDKNLAAAHRYVQSITGDRNGDLWVSIQQHGVYRRHAGVWTPYGNLPGLPKSTAVILWTDPAGRVWFGYLGNQIALVEGYRVRTFSAPDGLHTGNVLAIGGRGDHIWAAGQFGLALFDGNQFHTIAGETDADFRGISGVVETAGGDFWLNMATGVARIPASGIADRLRDPKHRLPYDLFDFRDGVKGIATQIRPLPSAVEAGDGRIWISGSSGVFSIDPARIYRNPVSPPVTIEAIYAGDQRFSAFEAAHLPKLPQNVRVEYTALSLSIPERVRFRYQLVGYDKDWQDAGTRRTASYTKLPPGSFRFHVIASNNDGVWNQTGAVAEIVIPPAFYQTAWFAALGICVCLALLWQIYFWRLHQLSEQMHGRLEARLAERERIARELHDTLLQSFQGLMLRLQVVDELLPPGKAKDQLEQSLERGDQAIAEGRSAVQNLRTTTSADLAAALQDAADELACEGSPAFRIVVEGAVRDLDPILRDELYRIARECLRNAFQHGHAKSVEAELTYGKRIFRLRVRDDGCGIPPEILQEGRSGHYGLSGIRERARQTGCKLDIWSSDGRGTEIDLSAPGSIAYSKSPKRGPRFPMFG